MDTHEIKDLMEGILASGKPSEWLVDSSVYFDAGFASFAEALASDDSDLLATLVRRRHDDPTWHRWDSLKRDGLSAPADIGCAALHPLMRVSAPAALAVLDGLASGWAGHVEALIPTLVDLAKLKIADIGGNGRFTPLERRGNWYD